MRVEQESGWISIETKRNNSVVNVAKMLEGESER